ncbi:MAG: hypothetical protein ACREIT_10525, partial [Tepidisphaeraceae bacterium]
MAKRGKKSGRSEWSSSVPSSKKKSRSEKRHTPSRGSGRGAGAAAKSSGKKLEKLKSGPIINVELPPPEPAPVDAPVPEPLPAAPQEEMPAPVAPVELGFGERPDEQTPLAEVIRELATVTGKVPENPPQAMALNVARDVPEARLAPPLAAGSAAQAGGHVSDTDILDSSRRSMRKTATPPMSPRVSLPAPPAQPPGDAPAPSPASTSPQPTLAAQPLLFECAWEVCWQLGGIYTVLRSKVATMMERWGDRYFLIGPYNPNTAAVEFEEQPTEGVIRQTLDRLRAAGIPCHFGRWLIPGRPRAILLDYRARYRSLDADKYLMWADHHIATTNSDGEVNEVVAFGFTVAKFFRELTEVVAGARPVLAHFHEWMAGVAVPRIAHLKLPVATVFTTHATLLGRYIAGDNPSFYDHLPTLNTDAEATRYNIFPRHAIEKAAAHAATVFTTVSEVTAMEATRILDRLPDVILPNGLNTHRFAALHEFQNLHRQYKEQIHEFVMGHFFPSYTFDLDNTLYLFTSGRYEYRNKGMDLFIEAMYRLNQRMKSLGADRPTIVSFIITRAQTRNINVGVLQSQSMFDDLKNTCADITEDVGRRLFLAAATGRVPGGSELLNDDAIVRLKRAIHAWRTHRQPTIVTHDLADDAKDPVLNHLRHRGLF